jgi:creatinine amidohydrolase
MEALIVKKIDSKPRNNPDKKLVSLWLDELSMMEAEIAAKAGTVVMLPIGSVEEHGDHLPLCTDSLQPEYVALEVAKKAGCLIAPPLRYGVCNASRNFPGTISIQFDSLYRIARDVLTELIRNGFIRVMVLSGHAGQSHMAALRLAAQDVMLLSENASLQKKPRIMVLSDYDFAYELKGKYFSEKDGHAGAIETSRIMAIKPNLIKTKGKTSFPRMPRFEIVAHPECYFPSGVIGDPASASPSKGRMINKYVIKQVTNLVKDLKT